MTMNTPSPENAADDPPVAATPEDGAPEWSWNGTLNATGEDLTWDTVPGTWGDA